MTRGSNPPTPAQWNVHGWMAAYHASQRDPNTSSTAQSTSESKKEDMDTMTGGWRFEGKEKPPIIRICPKCQGYRGSTTPDTNEPNKETWCQDCKEGKPGPGHEPGGIRPASVSKDQDAANLNKSFFGGE